MIRWSLGLRHILYCLAGGTASVLLWLSAPAAGTSWSPLLQMAGWAGAFVTVASLVDLFLLGGTSRVRYESRDPGELTEKDKIKVRPRCPACRGRLTVWNLPWNRTVPFDCPHCRARLTVEMTFRMVGGQPHEFSGPD
jgi:hypothetical protein